MIKALKKNLRRTKRIEICGSIAAGKTTLCRFLAKDKAIFENFTSNPFYKKFYIDPVKYAFETEVTFTLQHYEAIKSANLSIPNLMADYSLYQDLAYANMNLSGKKHDIFLSLYKLLQEEIGHPDMVVFLECSPKVLSDRVKKRARPDENEIPLDYLEALQNELRNTLKTSPSKVITLSSEKYDFAHNSSDQKAVLSYLQSEGVIIPE